MRNLTSPWVVGGVTGAGGQIRIFTQGTCALAIPPTFLPAFLSPIALTQVTQCLALPGSGCSDPEMRTTNWESS